MELNIDVDLYDILSQLDKKEVTEYFNLDFDKDSPFELLRQFKLVSGYKRPLTPEELKKLICEWIDNNIYKCI